jgi:Fe-S-cluster containining protein
MPKKITKTKGIITNIDAAVVASGKSYHKAYDVMVERLVRQFKPSCKKGCSDCCKLLTLIGFGEALVIADFLLRMNRWQGLLDHLVANAKEHDFKGVTRVTYFEKSLPCAFLVDNLCSIYEHRPAVCRLLLMLTPPELCAPTAKLQKASIDTRNMWMEIVPYEMKVTEDYEMGVGEYGLYTAPVSIAVLDALLHLSRKSPATHNAIKKACEGVVLGKEWLAKNIDSLVDEGDVAGHTETVTEESLVQIRRGNVTRRLSGAPADLEQDLLPGHAADSEGP